MPTLLVIDLPFPPSLNQLWRSNFKSHHVYRSPKYQSWLKQAGLQWLICKPRNFQTISGPFLAEIVLSPPDKRHRDLDNHLKALLDFLQSSAIIENDKYWRGPQPRWGVASEAPLGLRVTISKPEPVNVQNPKLPQGL